MHKVVIGLGFGDEGKGKVTDYLCSHHYPEPEPSAVVRFCGGHQVSHTVVTDKLRHVFANFGSGTLRGIPTYWSKFCTVEPMGLYHELKILLHHGVKPKLWIDGACPITTPYDIMANESREKHVRHGSCGVGFGHTMQREADHYSLTFMDCFYPQIFRAKLANIENYYRTAGLPVVPGLLVRDFIDTSLVIANNCPEIQMKVFPSWSNNLVFEGSQGLMLDQNFGFFPNVTRSNTGLKNVAALLDDPHYIDLYLVTRAYQTRHGNGFMSNENRPSSIIIDKDESNVENEYQGKFKRSMLDVSMLEYAIKKDELIQNVDDINLVITCLDHVVNDYRFTYEDRIYGFSNEREFVTEIARILDIKDVYLSRSSNSDDMTHFDTGVELVRE